MTLECGTQGAGRGNYKHYITTYLLQSGLLELSDTHYFHSFRPTWNLWHFEVIASVKLIAGSEKTDS